MSATTERAETERADVHVTVLGERVRLILPGDGWTFEEAKVAKNVSEGMSPAQIEGSILEGDPDAWLAVLRVSYLRAEKDFPSQMIGGQDVMQLMRSLSDEVREAMKRRPPTSASGNGSSDLSPTPELEPDADQS
jgi:hypothetical protein